MAPKQRIQAFETIRDIPYRIGDRHHDATCKTKVMLLGEILSKSGLKCRAARCQFKLASIYPQSSKNLILPHTFLQVHIPETSRWVNVDPTWDIGLKNILPIGHWDGIHNTILAITPLPHSLKQLPLSNLRPRNIKKLNQLHTNLNHWLDNARK